MNPTVTTRKAAPLGWLVLQGLVLLPISFICLTIGPQYISATETNLMLLLETVLGPVWVYAAGYGALLSLATSRT
jgi:drug/metabolite transporter (DMT)-like permease